MISEKKSDRKDVARDALSSPAGGTGAGAGTGGALAEPEKNIDSPKWPAEYIATQQLGLSLLCSFISSIPTGAVPTPPLADLSATLTSFAPLQLFREWAGAQRGYAERELDLRTEGAEPWASTCNSKTQNGPNRALQPGSTYWQSKANREETEWRVSFKEGDSAAPAGTVGRILVDV